MNDRPIVWVIGEVLVEVDAASLLESFLRCRDPQETLIRAKQLAEQVCTIAGAVPSLDHNFYATLKGSS